MSYTMMNKGWVFVNENGEKDYRILDIMLTLQFGENESVDVSEFNCRLKGKVFNSDRFEVDSLIKTNIIEKIVLVDMFSGYFEVTTRSGSKYRIKPQWNYTQIIDPDEPLSEINKKIFGF